MTKNEIGVLSKPNISHGVRSLLADFLIRTIEFVGLKKMPALKKNHGMNMKNACIMIWSNSLNQGGLKNTVECSINTIMIIMPQTQSNEESRAMDWHWLLDEWGG